MKEGNRNKRPQTLSGETEDDKLPGERDHDMRASKKDETEGDLSEDKR